MASNTSLSLVLLMTVCSVSVAAYVEAVAGVFDITRGHILPQVAFKCGFRNKHMDLQTGVWVDGEDSSPCDVSKNAILDYCRRVYSEQDVNNIEDSNEDMEISHWCPMDAPDIPEGCTETFTVTTYTCLVGNFESKALMVPKGCNFEHIHDSETCKPKSELHSMAEKQCSANGKTVRDYGMLLPCQDEVDLFTGVEFVCCVAPAPKKVAAPAVPEEAEVAPPMPKVQDEVPEKTPVTETEVEEEEEEEEEEEVMETEAEEEEEEEEEDETQEGEEEEEEEEADPMPDDPYFKEAPAEGEERDAFEDAKKRMEEAEDLKRTQVVQQWQEAQEQYETLKKTNPKEAEAMKKDMMIRFDDTMAELEEASRKEHEQLRSVHQRRVQSMLNDQRTLAEQKFAEILREENPKAKTVLHGLQKYIKVITRSKQHSLNVYKHLLAMDPAHAEHQRVETLSHLEDMDASLQHCLDMVKKVPEVYEQIQDRVADLLDASQTPEDAAFLKSMETSLSITSPTEEEEEEIEDEEEEEEDEEEVEETEVEVVEVEPVAPKETVEKTKPAKPAKAAAKALPKPPIVAKILPPFGKVPSGRKVPQVPDLPMVIAQIEPEEPEELEPQDTIVAKKGVELPAVKIVNAEVVETEETGPDALVDENVAVPQHIPIIAVKPLDRYLDNEGVEEKTEEKPSVPAEPTVPEVPAKAAAKPILVAKKQPQKTQKAAASRMDKGAEFRPKSSNSIDNSVSQKSLKYGATPALAFGLACGVLAVATVMVVAVVLVRRKTRRVPVNHGFTEIDPNMTVEQRHIAAMQANGYENPTYKYFEMQ